MAPVATGLSGGGEDEQPDEVRGVVLDPEARPLSGVELEILPGSRSTATTDAKGQFQMPWDPSTWGEQAGQEMVHVLFARHRDRDLALAVALGRDTRPLDLTLRPAISVEGKVVDLGGKAIADAQVRIMLVSSFWASSVGAAEIRTDAQGRFIAKIVPPDNRYRVTAKAEGFGTAFADIEAEKTAKTRLVDMGRLTLPWANLTVSGRVVDAGGSPMPDAHVHGYGEGQVDCWIQADARGCFTMNGLRVARVNVSTQVRVHGKILSGRVVTEAGATDVRVVVSEGRSPVRYIRVKTREQILRPGNRFLAGQAVDEKGLPVADVPVQVCCRKTLDGGRPAWHYGSSIEAGDVTDPMGQFVIELREGGEYNLLFSPRDQSALIVYDLPVGTQDLKVTLPEGGTIRGHLVRFVEGEKTPIANAEVTVQQTGVSAYNGLGYDQDRTIRSDGEGRFQVEHLCTRIRMDLLNREYGPREWKVWHGGTSQTVRFDEGVTITEIELVVQPDPTETGSSEDSVAGVSVKAFLDAQTILDRWKANCTGFKSLRFKVSETLLHAEGPDSNSFSRFYYIDRVQDGNSFLVRYTRGHGSPEDVNSGSLGVMSFDGRFRKEYEPWFGRGVIFRGLTGAFPELHNPIQNYMGSLPIKMEGMIAIPPSLPQDHPSRRVVEQCKREYPDGVPGLTFHFMLYQANGHLRVLPELESIRGTWCHVVEMDEVKPKSSTRYWFAHDKGMLPVKHIREDGGGDYSRMEFLEVASVSTNRGRFWSPKVATRESKHDAEIVKYELKVDEFIPDIEVAPETFDVDFPDRTKVLYFVRYKSSTWDKDKAHVLDDRDVQFRGHGSFIWDKTKTLVFDEREGEFRQVPR